MEATQQSTFTPGGRLAASEVARQWESTAKFSGTLDPVKVSV